VTAPRNFSDFCEGNPKLTEGNLGRDCHPQKITLKNFWQGHAGGSFFSPFLGEARSGQRVFCLETETTMLTSCSPKRLTTEGRANVHHPFLLSLTFCLQSLLASSASLKQVSTLWSSLFQSWILHIRLFWKAKKWANPTTQTVSALLPFFYIWGIPWAKSSS